MRATGFIVRFVTSLPEMLNSFHSIRLPQTTGPRAPTAPPTQTIGDDGGQQGTRRDPLGPGLGDQLGLKVVGEVFEQVRRAVGLRYGTTVFEMSLHPAGEGVASVVDGFGRWSRRRIDIRSSRACDEAPPPWSSASQRTLKTANSLAPRHSAVAQPSLIREVEVRLPPTYVTAPPPRRHPLAAGSRTAKPLTTGLGA